MAAEKERKIFPDEGRDALIVGFNEKGGITHWNKASELCFGYPREDAIAGGIKTLTRLVRIFTENPNLTEKEAKTYFKSMILGETTLPVSSIIPHANDGSQRHIKWYCSVMEVKTHKGSKEIILTGIDTTAISLLKGDAIAKDRYAKTVKRRLKRYISLDPQTALLNYRRFMKESEKAYRDSVKERSSMAILIIGLHNFNSVNLAYGITGGNCVLRTLADLIKSSIRRNHIAARVSGAEFAVLMPGTDIKSAHLNASKLYSRITEHVFYVKSGNAKVEIPVHMALGGYPHCEDISTAGQLIDRVKNKLEQAKRSMFMGVTICTSNDSFSPEGIVSPQEAAANCHTFEFVNALAKAVKSKDSYTHEHSVTMSRYAVGMARRMGMNSSAVRDVMMGSILHDIGKIGVDETILLKRGSLTRGEFSIVKQHPVIGAEIIRDIRLLERVVPLVLYHHERFDGKGYLNGLKGEEIPLGARIISLADVFQALTSDRPYRSAFSEQEALSMIESASGKYFDPEIVKAFFDVHLSSSSTLYDEKQGKDELICLENFPEGHGQALLDRRGKYTLDVFPARGDDADKRECHINVGGRIRMDLRRFEVYADGRRIDLTATEFNLLKCLASREGQVFTRERILDYLWGDEKIVVHNTVDVHIRHIRAKLAQAGVLIKSVRGVGYKIESDPS